MGNHQDRLAKSSEIVFWHQLEVSEVLERLNVLDTAQGLSSVVARERLKLNGPNELISKKRNELLGFLFKQICAPVNTALIMVAMVSLILVGVGPNGDIGERYIQGTVIIIVVLVYSILLAWATYSAIKLQNSLSLIPEPTSNILRDGEVGLVPNKEIVSGDIILLEPGHKVPADIRLIEVRGDFKVNEMLLNGNPDDCLKTLTHIETYDPSVFPSNMVFSGALVTSGSAQGVVVETGARTRMGFLAQLLVARDGKEDHFADTTKYFKGYAFLACVLIFIVGCSLGSYDITNPALNEVGDSIIYMLLLSTSLLVVAMNANLPIFSVLSSVSSFARMSKEEILKSEVRAGEGMENTALICIDVSGVPSSHDSEIGIRLPNGFSEALARAKMLGVEVMLITSIGLEEAQKVGLELKLLESDDDLGAVTVSCDSLRDLGQEIEMSRLLEPCNKVKLFARATAVDAFSIKRSLRNLEVNFALVGYAPVHLTIAGHDGAKFILGFQLLQSSIMEDTKSVIFVKDDLQAVVRTIELEKGRVGNLNKCISYSLSVATAEILVLAVSIFATLPSLRTPLQILFLNCLTGYPICTTILQSESVEFKKSWSAREIFVNAFILSTTTLAVYVWGLSFYLNENFSFNDLASLFCNGDCNNQSAIDGDVNDEQIEKLEFVRTVTFIASVVSNFIAAWSFSGFHGMREKMLIFLLLVLTLFVPGLNNKVLQFDGASIGWEGWVAVLVASSATFILFKIPAKVYNL